MSASAQDQAYIAWRIIDACLREDLRGIVSRGRWATSSSALNAAWPGTSTTSWWQIDHLPDGTLWLPAREDDFMQPIRALGDGWLLRRGSQLVYEQGSHTWLARMAAGLDPATRQLHRAYAEEAACAASHRRQAGLAYAAHGQPLAQALSHPLATERALLCDRVASFRDHPFYPTARAKSGFDDSDLAAYAPEFDSQFELHWLAVPRHRVSLTSPPPAFWPIPSQLGLPSALDGSHHMLPVHPLTWRGLDGYPLPEDSHRAPTTWLAVRPTLSVRTVVPLEYPHSHIKLPLLMYTLGALNLRLIKPSTLYDGHWFERVLTSIGTLDSALRDRYLHVDESHGGHVDEARHLAYLVRRYPPLAEQTLVPVAALCGEMPDGRALAVHLAERFYAGDLLAWWRDYVDLLAEVHLRLWLRWGIALEANQQNSVLIYAANAAPKLLMKDNDAARVLLARLQAGLPEPARFGNLRDPRIAVDDDLALGQMFCTIIVQLNLLAVLEGLAESQPQLRDPMYAMLRQHLRNLLQKLAAEGIDTGPAERLLGAPQLPVKYLLSAGSLLSKQATGASDINKFYGDSGPNFMLVENPLAHQAGLG